MIKAYSKTQNLQAALRIFHMMLNDQKSAPNIITFNSVIDCCVRCQEMKEAWSIFQQMSHNEIEPDLITFSTLIKGYCRVKNIEMALILHQ